MNLNIIILIFLVVVNVELYAQSNLADQRFLDNAEQFSEQEGVQIYSDSTDAASPPVNYTTDGVLNSQMSSGPSSYTDPNLVPISKVDVNESKNENKKMGISFGQMAKFVQKKEDNSSAVQAKKKSFGFTFSQMANAAQKNVTPNRK